MNIGKVTYSELSASFIYTTHVKQGKTEDGITYTIYQGIKSGSNHCRLGKIMNTGKMSDILLLFVWAILKNSRIVRSGVCAHRGWKT